MAAADDVQDAVSFDDVLKAEVTHIHRWRERKLTHAEEEDREVDQQLVGLALSGGGVRSAVFGLGVLQGLARFGLLRHLDYLSSTGGGAQIAGWLLRWIRAVGIHNVEQKLSGKGPSNIEAAEIQALRRAIASPKRRNSSIAGLAVLLNIAMNLLAVAAIMGAAILLTRIVLERLHSLHVSPVDLYVFNLIVIGIVGVLLLLLRIKRSLLHPPTQFRTFLIVLVLLGFAAVLVRIGASVALSSYVSPSIWSVMNGLAITFFCLIIGLSRPMSLRAIMVHIGPAVAAGGAAGLLLYLSVVSVARQVFNRPDNETFLWIQIGLSLSILIEALAFLLYAALVKKWLSRGTHELFRRVGRTMLAFESLWVVVVVTWYRPMWMLYATVGLVALCLMAFLVPADLGRKLTKQPKFLRETLGRLAPFTFAVAITAIVALLLALLWRVEPDVDRWREQLLIIILPMVSFVFFSLIRTREFTVHRVHRSGIIRNYLTPATYSVPETGTADIELSDIAKPTAPEGPYPLFGAAVEVAELGSDSSTQLRTVPFTLSPLYSGFELTNRSDSAAVSPAYRPTEELGGGISLATAIAISEPIRDGSFRPPSGAASMLWTILNMRDGRFVGNPLRNDTWRDDGPLIEPLYALRETDLAIELPFVRPAPSQDFDYLGIYQLVKRHCRLIIACDATNDPDFSFDEFRRTIFRCRTELGVEIQMDLALLGRVPATAHYQIAQIKYSTGQDGFMVYIKPSLTGDEPISLVQYARVHPEFPAKDMTQGRFGEADFESYRGLGQHIVESVFAEVKIDPKRPTNQVLRQVRQGLQPDFAQPEPAVPTPAPAEAKRAVVIPQELVEGIASGECVLCAGSGLAAQAELPTWSALLEGLLSDARQNRVLDTATADSLVATIAAGDYEAAADELMHEVPRERLLQYVRSVTSGAKPSQAHMLLARMKFLGVLNLSIDELLGTAFNAPVFVPSQAAELVAKLQSREFFLANLFGTPSQPSSVLLTMKDFRHLLGANPQLKQFLGTLFLRYCVVFVGLGMDTLRDFMEALELPQTPEWKHYAIMPNAAQIDPVKVRVVERSYNIRVVDYQPRANYEGLPLFLDELQTTVRENLPESKTSKSLTLKSVALENIGPFHSLEVKFEPQWNLLLGDNGVGKTVLLKAIATALCGDKADAEAVARLLRVGATKGSITLKDENREYIVELARQTDGSVHIVSASLSPIIFERWLVLGFPALRRIPRRRPEKVTGLKREAPSADDLLPLLRGEPDDRIADLKQWLVNLDYARKQDGPDSRAQRLWDDFFRVLKLLTEGLRFEPGNIDTKTMEITVVTDSGPVPLEFVSQGTAAVMSWIGALLERLSETGGNSALVLIDELDAHMHPKWQQRFVNAFREEFKSVQIIATTHSPLLIGSLKPKEIHLVQRAPLKSDIYGEVHLKKIDEDTQEVIVVAPLDYSDKSTGIRDERRYRLPIGVKLLVAEGETVEEFEHITKDDVVFLETIESGHQGLRADQILTSPLFELQTTRDPETANLMSEYTRLAALSTPTEKDTQLLSQVAEQLQIRTATPKEQHAARIAYSLIEDFATQQLSKLSESEREEILNEVKVQLTESITGSRRPE